MRRKDREVTDFEVIKRIIQNCDTIRLGFADGDYPYIVPLSFGYEIQGEQIYFYVHGAMEGRKVELMKKNRVCSFEMDCNHVLELLPQYKDVTMRYECLMGKAEIELLVGEEKQKALELLMDRCEDTRHYEYNRAVVPRTMAARLTVMEYSGKINPESVKTE